MRAEGEAWPQSRVEASSYNISGALTYSRGVDAAENVVSSSVLISGISFLNPT